MEATTLTWVVQGGSFALVVAIFGWGAHVLAPRVMKAFEDRDEKFEALIERIQDRNERELERRAAADLAMIASMNAIVTRLEALEMYGCSHRNGHQPGGDSGVIRTKKGT